jgi:hypothetical protein
MNDNHEQYRSAIGAEDSNIRIGAFAKRRNPIIDTNDTPENDVVSTMILAQKPLHVNQDDCNDDNDKTTAETLIALHARLEYAAALRSHKNTRLLISSLIEVSPRGNLTLVRFLVFVVLLRRFLPRFY